ncbi:GTP-binding protein Rit1 isoform X2 [Passer domesticus]|uniref:GTP-binding protein Rit1 isoform X2 n=1 Tax=Passer domesticus TaxID=48849 RepID=UPI0030FE63BF
MEPAARPAGGAGQPREYKLVMLGAGGVGKSAMTMQFISHRFPEDHDPTIEDAYKIRIRIDDEPANLDILDTAGQAEFTAMRDQYMRAGEGFIICYSITDRRSFHEVREFKQLIYRVRRTDDTPVVLVGNKSDLSQLRQVSKEEGSLLVGVESILWNLWSWVETNLCLEHKAGKGKGVNSWVWLPGLEGV